MPMSHRLLRPKASALPVDSSTLILLHFDSGLLVDSSVYNRTLIEVAIPPTTDANAQFGSASFATNYGIIGFLAGSTLPDLSTTDHTIECWLWVNSSNTAQSVTIAHFPVDYETTTSGQHFYYDNGGFHFNDGAATAAYSDGSVAPFTTDAWIHVAAVQQGTCKRIYVNGVLGAATDQASPSGVPNFTTGGYQYGPWLGAGGGGAINVGEILIDELRVSSRALYCGQSFTPPGVAFGSGSAPAATGCGGCCPPAGIYLWDGCGGEEPYCDLLLAYTDGECGETVVTVPGGCC